MDRRIGVDAMHVIFDPTTMAVLTTFCNPQQPLRRLGRRASSDPVTNWELLDQVLEEENLARIAVGRIGEWNDAMRARA